MSSFPFAHRGRPLAMALGLLALGLAVVVPLGCSKAKDAQDTLRIGLILDGNTWAGRASTGHASLQAANLALEEIRTTGGLELGGIRRSPELEVESVTTPDEALAAARRLASTGVVAIIGPSISRHAIPVATVAEFAQIPMISPRSTHPLTTRNKRFVFRVAFTDDHQGRVLAHFAARHLKARRIAVLYDEASDYNRHIAQVFITAVEKLGGRIVGRATYITGETDFAPTVKALVETRPDLVFLPNYQHEVVEQARQLRRLGYSGPLLGGDGWEPGATSDPTLAGGYFCRHWDADYAGDDPRSAAFIATFEDHFGEPPNDLAALSYDAFGLLFRGLEQTATLDPRALRDELESIENFPGVTGRITYRGGGGDPEKPVLIFRITPDGTTELFGGTTMEAPHAEAKRFSTAEGMP